MKEVFKRLYIKIKKLKFKEIILNTFAILLFLLPVIPEKGTYALESRKWIMFNSLTIITSVILLITLVIEKKFKLNVWDGLLIIYLTTVSISMLLTKFGVWEAFTGSNGRGEGVLTIASYIITFIIFSKGYKYVKWTLKIAIVGAIIVSIYSVLQVMLPADIIFPEGLNRRAHYATGTMRNQNFLSSYICLFLPMMVFKYINKGRLINLFTTIMLFLALIFSVTLGGYLTFALMFIVILISSLIFNKNKWKVLQKSLLIVSIFIILFAGVDNIKGGKYSKELLNEKSKESTSTSIETTKSGGNGRLEIWNKSLHVISNNIWFGVGPDSLAKEINNKYVYGSNKGIGYKKVDKAHSEPLQIAATTGVPSMIIYLVFVGALCLELLKILVLKIKNDSNRFENKDNIFNAMVFISIISYLCQSVINISVIHVAPIFWAILGLGAGILINTNELNKEK